MCHGPHHHHLVHTTRSLPSHLLWPYVPHHSCSSYPWCHLSQQHSEGIGTRTARISAWLACKRLPQSHRENGVFLLHMGVSKNNGTPKSSILIGFSIINHPFWGFSPYFWKYPYGVYGVDYQRYHPNKPPHHFPCDKM